MKAINNFFDKASYWKVYLVAFLLLGSITFGMFQFLTTETFKPIVNLKISVAMGIIMGFAFTLMVSLSRKAGVFFEACDILQEKIKLAKTKSELKKLFRNDFMEVRKKAMHHNMYARLRELKVMMDTKYEYLEEG